MITVTLPMWQAVEAVAGYGPSLLAIPRRHQNLLRRCASSDDLLHCVYVLLSCSSSASGFNHSSCHSRVLQPFRSHNMTEKFNLTLPGEAIIFYYFEHSG